MVAKPAEAADQNSGQQCNELADGDHRHDHHNDAKIERENERNRQRDARQQAPLLRESELLRNIVFENSDRQIRDPAASTQLNFILKVVYKSLIMRRETRLVRV